MEGFSHKNSRQKHASIDGFTPGNGQVRRGGSISFDQVKKPASSGANLVDDFKRPEGLSAPRANTPITMPQTDAIRPERHAPKKSRLNPFGRYKNQTNLDGVDRYAAKRKRERRIKIASAACVAILVFGFFGYSYLRSLFGGGGGAAALEENVDPSKLRGEGDGRVNILLMGRGGEGYEAPDLTDTLLVASIDPVNKEAGLVSVPRDLYVTIPNTGTMKINEAFYTGKSQVLNNATQINNDVKHQADAKGYEMVKSTVENVLGIPIHYQVMVDFNGFKKAIDTVGGVDVNVPVAVKDHMRFDGQPYTLNVKPGQKHFEGFEALAYARSRYTSEGGDFARSERQRLILTALKDKILSAGTFSNPAKVAELTNAFDDHVETDFSLGDLNRLREISSGIDSGKIESIGLVDPPHDFLITANVGGLSVVLPKAGADNYKDIHHYIRNTLKDGFLKNENAQIMILNGTDRSGLATEKADELKSYGYNIGTVINAPTQNYANTILIDLRNGEKKYTRRYLEQRFGTVAVSNIPDSAIQAGNADFVIILGNDTRSSH